MRARATVIPALLTVACIALLQACAVPKHSVEMQDSTLSFYYRDHGAEMVYFASSADRFRYHPARLIGRGVWQVTVPEAEEFTYFYIVDGRVTLPDCQVTVADDFGSKNCLFAGDM